MSDFKNNPGVQIFMNALQQTQNAKGVTLIEGKLSETGVMKGYDSENHACNLGYPSLELAVRALEGCPLAIWFEKALGLVKMNCEFDVVTRHGGDVVPMLLSNLKIWMDIDNSEAKETEPKITEKPLELYMPILHPQHANAWISMQLGEFEYLKKQLSLGKVSFRWTADVQWIDVSDSKVLEQVKTHAENIKAQSSSINGKIKDFNIYEDSESTYEKVKGLLTWEKKEIGENIVWYKDTMTDDIFYFLPQIYRIKANPYTNAPQMAIIMQNDGTIYDTSKYSVTFSFDIEPYYHPRAKRDLYGIVPKHYCKLDYGGYESVRFEWSKEFDTEFMNVFNIVPLVNSEDVSTNPDSSFTIAFKCSLEFFDQVRKKLVEGGIGVGHVIFKVKNGLKGETVEIPIEVELNLRRMTRPRFEIKIPESDNKKIKIPYKMLVKNVGDYTLEIGGCEISYLSYTKKKFREARHKFQTISGFPMQIEAGDTCQLELTESAIKSLDKKNHFLGIPVREYWNEILCEPYSISLLDEDIDRIVSSYEDMATKEMKIWKLTIEANIDFSAYPTLCGILVGVRNKYGIYEIVELTDRSVKEVNMARTLPTILSTQSIEDRHYEYQVKVVCSSGESEWSEWTSASSSLCISPSNINSLIK